MFLGVTVTSLFRARIAWPKRPSSDRALPSIARLRAVGACANRAALQAAGSRPLIFRGEGSLSDDARALIDRTSASLALRVPALSPVSLILRSLPRGATFGRACPWPPPRTLRLVLERTVAVKAFEVNPHIPPAPGLGGGGPRYRCGADFAPGSVGPFPPPGEARSRADFAPILRRNRLLNSIFWRARRRRLVCQLCGIFGPAPFWCAGGAAASQDRNAISESCLRSNQLP
jgi:hypothetical protein